MLIDWFTVGAQALNFIILVYLMRRFLYKPILEAVDAREKKIAAELADAAAKGAEAEKERGEFQHRGEELEQQRGAYLERARGEAEAERRRLLDEARKDSEVLRDKRRDALRNDARDLNQSISRRTQQEVFAIARQVLSDLAATSLEERMAEVFIRRLRELDGSAKKTLSEAIEKSSDPAVVRSAFALPAEQRATIEAALKGAFSAKCIVQFETAPDLVSGIELVTNGQKVGWSVADYLGSLEKEVGELLKKGEGTRDKAEPKPKSENGQGAQPEASSRVRPESRSEPKAQSAPDAKGP